MKKTIIILVSMVYCTSQLYSQTESIHPIAARAEFQAKQVIPPSPIAAELGKYGNTPVSLFTGTPNISIPLYELKGNQLSLPISLSYNASGFRPQDQATWVGSGWSLNAGGVITRSVMGNPDIESNYFGASNPLDPPPGVNSFPLYDYMTHVREGLIESQPDIYYFNFAGYAGKFLIEPDNNIVNKKKDMLKIVSNISSVSSRFTITDENGSVYTFSEAEHSTIIPSDDVGSPSNIHYQYPSSWFLSSIQSPDGQERIDFEYHSTTVEQNLHVNVRNNESHTFQYIANSLSSCPTESAEMNSFLPVTSRIRPKFLKKVTLKRNGAIVAFVDLGSSLNQRQDSQYSQDRLLEQIEVYKVHNDVSIPIKKYGLTYGYFINTSNVFDKKRLRLDEVHDITASIGTAVIPPYKFSYNTNVPIPDRFTTSLDHWGYFNNKNNPSLVPSETVRGRLNVPKSLGGKANREPSFEGSSCTMLDRIQYPTGGYSTFAYELNEAVHDSVSYPIGGVRIRRITDFSFEGRQATAKEYRYDLQNNKSSGKIGNLPVYLRESSRTEHFIPYLGSPDPCNDYDKQIRVYTVSANSIFGLGSIQGNHVGYSRVAEINVDNNNNPLGKTIYNYNIDYSEEYDNHIGNGDLVGQSDYRNDDKLLKESIYTYQYETTETVYGYVVKAADHQTNRTKVCWKSDNSYVTYGTWESTPPGCVEIRTVPIRFFLSGYTIKSQYGKLVALHEKSYEDASDSYSIKTISYQYDNVEHTYPTKITQSSIGETEVVTLKKYAADYDLVTWSDIPSTAIHYLQSLNMGKTEIETIQYRQNTDGSNKRYISAKLVTFKHSGIPLPERILELESDVPLLSVQPSIINNGVFIYDEAYKPSGNFKYAGDNLIEQAKENGPISSYIWAYNDLHPIASVSNAQSNAIAYTGFETDLSNSWVAEGIAINNTLSLSGKRSGILLANSKISKLFISAPKQLLLSYWSRENLVDVMGNSNVSVPRSMKRSTINGWTYYEHLMPVDTYMVELKAAVGGSTTIDELRLHPMDAQMETLSYDERAAVNTRVSVSNKVQYYEYDGIGRLKNIRDEEKQVLQSFAYNYGPGISPEDFNQTLFYNVPKQQSFTKQGCTIGTPEVVQYSVPHGKYAAATQSSADSLAQQEVLEKGQSHANTVGRCLFYNTVASGQFFKMDCPPEQGLGLRVTYTVSAGKYAVEESQAKADSLALADVTANGQAYANSNGTCSCVAEGQKAVNGVCETGVKIYISSTPDLPSGWRCVYIYQFSDNSESEPYTIHSTSRCINN